MGHARLPRAARQVARDVGWFPDGAELKLTLWRHTVRGDDTPTLWIVWLWPEGRHTRQFSGPRGEQRAMKLWAELEEILAESRNKEAS